MAEINSPGLSVQDVMAIIAQNASTSYVGGSNSNPMTVTSLLASYPPSISNVGAYARVSDLYGSVDDIVRCRFDGANYRWVPQREAYSGTVATTGGALSILPLITPPTIRLTGSLTANINAVPSVVNAYVGQRQRIINNSVLGLFTASVTGLIGSNLSLLGNGSQVIEYGATGWFASS